MGVWEGFRRAQGRTKSRCHAPIPLLTTLLGVLISLSLAAPAAGDPAGWGIDTRLTTNPAESRDPALAMDPWGNTHIAWQDSRTGSPQVFYTKLDNSGFTLVDDLQITSNAVGLLLRPIAMAVDTQGNPHITWTDYRDGNAEVYYTKLDNNGATLVDDVRLTFNSESSGSASPAADSAGNVHIVWSDSRDTPGIGMAELYYTKLDPAGFTLVDDLRLTFASGGSWDPSLRIDAQDTLHVAWEDVRDGNFEIYYMKLNANGAILVPDTRLTFHGASSLRPAIWPDAQGNPHVAWEDNRDGNFEIYYTKLNPAGATLVDDLRLTTAAGTSGAPSLSTDAARNVHIAWFDYRDSDYEMYYTKLDENGLTLVDDLRLTVSPGNSWEETDILGIDRQGNVHLTWFDLRDGNYEIYYKRSLADIFCEVNKKIMVLMPEINSNQIPNVRKPSSFHIISYAPFTVDFTLLGNLSNDKILCKAESSEGQLPIYLTVLSTKKFVAASKAKVNVTVFKPDTIPFLQECNFSGGITNDCLLNGPFNAGAHYVFWNTEGFVTEIFPFNIVDWLPRTLYSGKLNYWVNIDLLGLSPETTPIEKIVQDVEVFIHRTLIQYLPLIKWYYMIQDPGAVNLLITDESGNTTGILQNGSNVSSIPGSYYFPSGENPTIFIVEPSLGVLQINLTGRNQGNFALLGFSANLTFENRSSQNLFESTILQDQTVSLALNVGSTPDGSPLQTLSIPSCGNLTGAGVYVLDQDITPPLSGQSACMHIAADDVTLDCRGRVVRGPDPQNGTGILAVGRRGIALMNCRVENFIDGIRLESTMHSLLFNNTAAHNKNYALYLSSSSNNTILSNTVRDACCNGFNRGIMLASSHANTVSLNVGETVVFPFHLYDSSYNTVTYNTAIQAGTTFFNGFSLQGSSFNVVSSNKAKGTDRLGSGFDAYFSANSNAFLNNTADNLVAGFVLGYNTFNNTFSGNSAINNSGSGFQISDTFSNAITSNRVTGNYVGLSIAESAGIPTINNTLSHNTIASNNYGLRISAQAKNNIIVSNVIENNAVFGADITASQNLFYNNFFNNSRNAVDSGRNQWNITKTPGTNSIGESFLGGNFWSDYTGRDRNGDGLGDTRLPHNSTGGIKIGGDYLPLVHPPQRSLPRLFGGQNCTPPPPGMLGWWPGDGNAVDIAGGNNGTLRNGAAFGAGKVKQAFSFDGVDDFMDTASPVSITNSRLTMDAWVYSKALSRFQKILKVHTAGYRDVWLGTDNLGNAEFAVYDTGGANHLISAPISTNTWTHLAGTYDGAVQKLYVNGVLAASASWSGSFLFNDLLFVGRDHVPIPGHPFNGTIDEVELFNRALASPEVLAIYTAGSAGKCKG
ncbi:MAG: right-handed parallel beta-helix repeat-containing protein [Candidatus Aenigmarchaeota archaeon]|nr:right-handed parallel beta-helix repeat-containing protein [Candidatus Aenigmarchaeota archaeon]